MGQLSLRQQLEQLLQSSNTDQELAENIISSPLLKQLISQGAATNEEAAKLLGYKSKRSVDSMVYKSRTFPKPVLSGVFWSVQHLREYQKNKSSQTNGR